MAMLQEGGEIETQSMGPTNGPEVPPEGDGMEIVMKAMDTLVNFALAQKEQGNPAVQEAMQGLMQAMGAGAQQESQPPAGQPPAQPPQAGPQPGGNTNINAI